MYHNTDNEMIAFLVYLGSCFLFGLQLYEMAIWAILVAIYIQNNGRQ